MPDSAEARAATRTGRRRRVAAGLGALALVPVVWAGPFIAVIAFEFIVPPSPFVRGGDPCCAYPDTMAEVRNGAVVGVLVSTVFAAALVALFLLIRCAACGRRPPWKWAGRAALATCIATSIGAGIAYARLGEHPSVKVCRAADEALAADRFSSEAEKERAFQQVEECTRRLVVRE